MVRDGKWLICGCFHFCQNLYKWAKQISRKTMPVWAYVSGWPKPTLPPARNTRISVQHVCSRPYADSRIWTHKLLAPSKWSLFAKHHDKSCYSLKCGGFRFYCVKAGSDDATSFCIVWIIRRCVLLENRSTRCEARQVMTSMKVAMRSNSTENEFLDRCD